MDIVERLREAGDHASFDPHLHHKAADEIEWLREALRTICDGPRDVEKSYAKLFAEVKTEARSALQQKGQ